MTLDKTLVILRKIQGYLWGNDMGNENEKKLQPVIKKVVSIKGSFYLCLPKKFVNHYGIRTGDQIALVPGAELIRILPVKVD